MIFFIGRAPSGRAIRFIFCTQKDAAPIPHAKFHSSHSLPLAQFNTLSNTVY